jgi:hypothetical protein
VKNGRLHVLQKNQLIPLLRTAGGRGLVLMLSQYGQAGHDAMAGRYHPQ